jgi:hypothetical protein
MDLGSVRELNPRLNHALLPERLNHDRYDPQNTKQNKNSIPAGAEIAHSPSMGKPVPWPSSSHTIDSM